MRYVILQNEADCVCARGHDLFHVRKSLVSYVLSMRRTLFYILIKCSHHILNDGRDNG